MYILQCTYFNNHKTIRAQFHLIEDEPSHGRVLVNWGYSFLLIKKYIFYCKMHYSILSSNFEINIVIMYSSVFYVLAMGRD